MQVSVSAQFLKNDEAGNFVSKSNYVIDEFLFIKQGSVYHKVKIDDITHLESDNVYINVNVIGNKFLVRSTIDQYLEILNSRQFFRIHRSYAINLNHIQFIDVNHITVGDKSVPMGKAYKNELLKKLRIG